jgi:hypothetical protein
MGRFCEQLARARILDDLAEIHDGRALGDAAYHVEIVADQQIGEAKVALQVEQQIEELALDRYVEPGGRLVRDDDLGTHHERASDADAASLSSRDLMRKLREHVGRQAEALQDVVELLTGLRAWQRMNGDRLLQRAADRHPRRQRGDRILQQQLHAPAECERRLGELLPDRAAADFHRPRRERRESDQHTAQRALARSGFADKPEDFALADGERDVIEGTHSAVEHDAHVGEFDERGSGGRGESHGCDGFASSNSISSHRTQAARLPGPASRNAGIPERQTSRTCGQRGANTHASRTSTGSGTSPGIETNRRRPPRHRARKQAARVCRVSWAPSTSATDRSRRSCRRTSRKDRRKAARRGRDGAK